MDSLSSVLRQRRKALGLTLSQIADMMDVAEATVQRWESGNIKSIRYEKIGKLAEILCVSPAALMGWQAHDGDASASLPSNVVPLQPMRKVPLVGRIACGTPILAEQNIEDYIDLPGHIHADYALTCQGDSMVNAGIRDGDVVYIRQQPEVETGQIAAVMVDEEEATLKRFYFDGANIQLVAENPRIPPMVFPGSEISRVRVLGRAVAYTHIVE